MSGGVSAGTLMSVSLGMQAAGALNAASAAKRNAQMQQRGYEYQAAVTKNNQEYAEMQAQDALVRGGRAEQSQRLKTAQLKSAQRARLAANGVALDEGSALSILQDTEYMGEMDALTLRDNAAREAYGLRRQASNYGSDASFLSGTASSISPNSSYTNTLLTSGGQVADSWYRYSRKAA